MVETRISTYRFAEMDEDTEHDLKVVCKNFAKTMMFNFEFDYYAVYWTPENWLLAKLAMPEIDTLLKVNDGTPKN